MDEQVVLFRRAIPPERFSKAVTFALLAVNTVGIATLLLCITEKNLMSSVPYGTLSLFFEATSAFGTVGLSTGVTTLLSVYGKLILVATMFIGRVGLLTLLIAIIGRKSKPIRYPHEEILVD